MLKPCPSDDFYAGDICAEKKKEFIRLEKSEVQNITCSCLFKQIKAPMKIWTAFHVTFVKCQRAAMRNDQHESGCKRETTLMLIDITFCGLSFS